MIEFSADHIVANQTLTQADIDSLSGTPHRLVECEAAEVDLSGLNLSNWTLDKCDFRRANFTGARLENTQWRSCRGAFACFVGSDLSEARFTASDFNNVSFKRSILEGARFAGCKLTGSDHFANRHWLAWISRKRTFAIVISGWLRFASAVCGIRCSKRHGSKALILGAQISEACGSVTLRSSGVLPYHESKLDNFWANLA